MFAHFTPSGGREAWTLLDLRPSFDRGGPLPHATVGRAAEQDVRLDAPRASKRHGAFTRDSTGALRFVDLGSHSGSVFVPVRGTARPVQAGRPVALLPGDAIALGGTLPNELTREALFAKMHVLQRLQEPCLPAEAAEGPPPPEDPILQILSCPVCQETLRGARVLPCGHVHCDDCISRWFREHATCPTCRAACDAATLATAGVPCLALDDAAAAFAERLGDARAVAAHREYGTHAGLKKRKRITSEPQRAHPPG
jgi:hypothetical protein